MKRIRTAFPIESVQGKLAASQDLRYGENSQKAFDAASANAQYANNYKPAMVAALIKRTGLNYFIVKTKSAFKGTAAALLECALMGATSAIYAKVIKDLSILTSLNAQFSLAREAGYEGTFHKWITAFIRADLEAGAASIQVVGPTATVNCGNNPYSDAATAIAISSKLLVKFWKQLTEDGIQFTVAGVKGIAMTGMEFGQLIAKERLNNLGLTLGTGDDLNYVKLGDKYVYHLVSGTPVGAINITEIQSGEEFYLSDTKISD